MRTPRTFLLVALALLGAAGPARAAEAPLPPPLPPPPSHAPADPRLGVALDLGFPEGASLALAYRPTQALRIFAGPAWNYVSWGVLGGVALVPFRLAVAPTLSAEVGHYFRADLTHFVNESSGAPAGTEPLFRRVGVTYAAAHIGAEIGTQRGLAFSIRAGLAYLVASSQGRSEPTGTGAQVTLRDPRVHATAPSVKLGLEYAF